MADTTTYSFRCQRGLLIMKRYKVEPIKQKYGIYYGVVFQGLCKFVKKRKEDAQEIADRLNLIRERKETEGWK